MYIHYNVRIDIDNMDKIRREDETTRTIVRR